MRLLFRQRTGSARLLKDKKRCKMIIDEVCESGVRNMEECAKRVRWHCSWEKVKLDF